MGGWVSERGLGFLCIVLFCGLLCVHILKAVGWSYYFLPVWMDDWQDRRWWSWSQRGKDVTMVVPVLSDCIIEFFRVLNWLLGRLRGCEDAL